MTVILIEADIQNEKRGSKKDKFKDENKSNEIYVNYKSIFENTLNLCQFILRTLKYQKNANTLMVKLCWQLGIAHMPRIDDWVFKFKIVEPRKKKVIKKN